MKRVYSSCRRLPIDDEEGSLLKCRERRRRRIEMGRSSGSDDREAQKLAGVEMEKEKAETYSAEETTASPVYGLMSVVGRAREMEDEISVRTNLCRPEINSYRPVHFFGVFDGHGGHHVSSLCKEHMHVIMEDELMRVKPTGGEAEELWRTAINRSFERMDEMATSLCVCDGLEKWEACRYHPHLSLVGSTAVVLLLTQELIIVANCGDSRAVLCRNGKAVPLSVDHKPEREDERARIEGCGGRILYAANGARVEGVLAMSRAIGDRLIKDVVISEPECSFTKRNAGGDMGLILGSDGLWDVLSSEWSCEVVEKCLERVGGATSAAALLVRLAMGRRSTDNISVIVVDLRN